MKNRVSPSKSAEQQAEVAAPGGTGEVDRPRRIELRKAGASDIIHKDDIDSVNVSEALIRAYAPRGQ